MSSLRRKARALFVRRFRSLRRMGSRNGSFGRCGSERLDWLLILNADHLMRTLTVFIDHYNGVRPHRSLGLTPPNARTPMNWEGMQPITVRRRDRLGGLLREYERAALTGIDLFTPQEPLCRTAGMDTAVPAVVGGSRFSEHASARRASGIPQCDRRNRAAHRPATEQLRQLASTWRWAPVVAALQALRGVSFVTAVALVAELGTPRGFGHPRELMAYLDPVPSEHSSGPSVRRGGITKAGNPHVRRLLAEAAWAYQGIPRIGRQHASRQETLSKVVCDIAWKAQLR